MCLAYLRFQGPLNGGSETVITQWCSSAPGSTYFAQLF